MPRPDPPDAIVALAAQRSQARAARDWPLADELRGHIEAAGWRVVDAGTDFSLSPAREPDIAEAGRTRYGTPASVPSRLDEPDRPGTTVVLVARVTEPSPVDALVAMLRHAPTGTDAIVVSDADAVAADAVALDLPPDIEPLLTAVPFSPGAALQAALRRATGALIVVLERDRLPIGDVIMPLSAALADPDVAIAGADGLRSTDLRRYQPAGPGEVTALGAGCFALRRRDAIARQPFDERLYLAGSVATCCSLVLRDEGPERPPRVALALDLPLGRQPSGESMDGDHARKARRDAYRLMDRFRRRSYLSAPEDELQRIVEDGPHDQEHGDDAEQQGHAAES